MVAYSIEQWLLFFYIYCFLGWCFESTYVSLCKGHRVNRGFLKAPFLPLYGSGAILMLIIGLIFGENTLWIYLAGVVAATVLELVTGAGMELLYRIKYWDYSNQRFNFKGHICLTSSIAWGFFTLLVIRVIHRPIETFVFGLPRSVVLGSVVVLTVVLVWDFVVSFKAAWDLRSLILKLEDMYKNVKKDTPGLKEIKEQIADICEHIQAELTARYEVRLSKLYEFTRQ